MLGVTWARLYTSMARPHGEFPHETFYKEWAQDSSIVLPMIVHVLYTREGFAGLLI